MARKHANAATEALEEFESMADRLAAWVGENAVAVVSGVLVLLVGTGAFSGYRSWTASAAREASSDLSAVKDAYLLAMGASPGALEIPELANPDTANRVRRDYIARFETVAEDHSGTVQAALARLEVGDLHEALGDPAAAAAAWKRAGEELPGGSALQGTILVRSARDHERNERWSEAADAYSAAGDLDDFPLRYWAMADAARCFDRAGDSARALTLLERVETEAPEMRLPEYLRARLRELRVAASGGASTPVAAGP